MTAILAAKEGICVKQFVIKLGVVHGWDNTMKDILCDNIINMF